MQVSHAQLALSPLAALALLAATPACGTVDAPPTIEGSSTGDVQVKRDATWRLADLHSGKAEGFARVLSIKNTCGDLNVMGNPNGASAGRQDQTQLWTQIAVADGEARLTVSGWVPMRGALAKQEGGAVVGGRMTIPGKPSTPGQPAQPEAECTGKAKLQPDGQGVRISAHERLEFEEPGREDCEVVMEAMLVF